MDMSRSSCSCQLLKLFTSKSVNGKKLWRFLGYFCVDVTLSYYILPVAFLLVDNIAFFIVSQTPFFPVTNLVE